MTRQEESEILLPPSARLIAYDCEEDRPGCVIVASLLGADTQLPQQFSPRSWLTHPTPAMRVYEVTDEQLAVLLARARERFGA